nr:MAG TPA: hypothetical protein [Caudoviricetes sp.]
MISSTAAYNAAITADARRILLRAVVDLVSPDIVYGAVDSSGADPYSNLEQLHDKEFELAAPRATMEQNRWLLDGSQPLYPEIPQEITGQMAFESSDLFGRDCEGNIWLEEQFSGVNILQACSIYFPDSDINGWPVDFRVDIKQGGTVYHTQTITGNTDHKINLTGFTVYNPDAIRITVTKWSTPFYRMRIPEILPGIYEIWNESIIATFNVTQKGDFSALSLPYGTCTLSMDNLDRRFEPRSKTGLFQSIEERQGIDIDIGVRLEDGTSDYKPVGVFYQFSGGWKTGNNGITMQWDLVDIIGLLSERAFEPPEALPETLSGWTQALVAQLGPNFKERFSVDPDYADLPVTVNSVNAVTDKSCGEILLWICQATQTWPRADAETGDLTIEPYWDEGGTITLDNITDYPTMSANEDIAAIFFTLSDGETKITVSGTSSSSPNTVSIENPFLHTQQDALKCAKMILSTYGGNQLTTTGRGNPASEIGDVDTVWLDESSATTGRRMSQSFQFSSGVLQGCQSVLLQADGSFLYDQREVITETGTWQAPSGVTSLRIILVGKGNDGTNGTDGTWEEDGKAGTNGSGGKVFASTININDGQTFDVTISDNTVFGAYSSANGHVYENGYTDVQSGDSYARTGVQMPLPGSGDGGIGGTAGIKGNQHKEEIIKTDEEGNEYKEEIIVVDNYPTNGGIGSSGAIGCAVIYWEVPDAVTRFNYR